MKEPQDPSFDMKNSQELTRISYYCKIIILIILYYLFFILFFYNYYILL